MGTIINLSIVFIFYQKQRHMMKYSQSYIKQYPLPLFCQIEGVNLLTIIVIYFSFVQPQYFYFIFSKVIQDVILLSGSGSINMSKPRQPPSKINSIFYTKNLTRLTNDGSYSLDLLEMRKNNTQMIQASKTMRLQKIKKQISMHLKDKKDFIGEMSDSFDKKPSQSVYLNEEETKYQSLMKRLRNHNAYQGHRSNQHGHNNQKSLRRRKQNTENKNKLIQMRKKSKERLQINQQMQQLHKKSFTIKQIKPQKKQRISKQMPICDPAFGKTYGSYYQIVAIQKKFFNSRYFFNGHTFNMLGGDKYEGLDQRYKSRIISNNNPQPKRGNKIFYAKYQGDVIEPWKLQDDHLHDGFD